MTGIVFVFLFFLLGSSEVQAQLPFYQGKSIRIVVGFAPGAAVDVWARVVARYWPKYIPGNPDIIVQNMPGGASMIAANCVYGVAKPDGLTLASIAPALYFDQLIGRKEVQFDWTKFAWIGSPEQIDELLLSVPMPPTRLWRISAKPPSRRSVRPPDLLPPPIISPNFWRKCLGSSLIS